jgi:hypothetical protein
MSKAAVKMLCAKPKPAANHAHALVVKNRQLEKGSPGAG